MPGSATRCFAVCPTQRVASAHGSVCRSGMICGRQACRPACVHERMHAHEHMQDDMPACMPACRHVCMHTTSMHACTWQSCQRACVCCVSAPTPALALPQAGTEPTRSWLARAHHQGASTRVLRAAARCDHAVAPRARPPPLPRAPLHAGTHAAG
eukprot:364496-Chlamydomonas_euryale.AAC.65